MARSDGPLDKGKSGKSRLRMPAFDVQVTQNHIDTAKPRNSGHCMHADAVRDAYLAYSGHSASWLSVDIARISFSDTQRRLRFHYFTPDIARWALIDFDQGDLSRLKPFTFRLDGKRGGLITPMRSSRIETVGSKKSRRNNPPPEELVERRLISQKDAMPIAVGGTNPPRGALSSSSRGVGARREFGAKTMKR